MQRGSSRFLSFALILAVTVTVRADEIDDWVKSQMQVRHVPAASIAVIKNGALVKAEGYGFANLEQNIPAGPETVYKIGSVSKQFIAAGIMLLVQDGKITLRDKVGRHIPGTPSAWQEITMRHLLTHTSGLVREARNSIPTGSSWTSMSSRQPLHCR